jgi:hypothetical protein
MAENALVALEAQAILPIIARRWRISFSVLVNPLPTALH